MKIKYLVLLGLVGTTVLSGCKKGFLDTEPSQFTTPEQLAAAAAQDPKVLLGSVAGLYTTMFTVGVGGTTGHDDFGQKGVDIYTDMLASDMVLGGVTYGWYSNLARLQSTTDFTRNDVYVPWRYYYRQIFGANTVIDVLTAKLGVGVAPTNATDRATMGQARAMRAYGYFYLTQLYAKEYGDGTAKILPIYTTASKDSLNRPKATAKQVWDLMILDLDSAVAQLSGFTRTAKDQVDRNVAKGLLCYALSSRGTPADWTRVQTLSQEIIAVYPKTDSTQLFFNGTNAASAGFNNVSAPAWMWGVDITLAQGLDLISWWGQVDQTSYSYAWAGDPKRIDRRLYDSIKTGDVRRLQFSAAPGLQPFNKFWAPARTSGGQRQIVTDLVYMRSDEFYLLNAEAKARNGQDLDARTALKSFLANRYRTAAALDYIDGLSGQALLDEIYLQTRIELWGEGKSYLALKRNKATVTRGSNHLFEAGNSFPYNDPKLTMVIPQAEVLNNPNLNL